MAVSRIEIEGVRNFIDIAKRKILYLSKVSMGRARRGEVRLSSGGTRQWFLTSVQTNLHVG